MANRHLPHDLKQMQLMSLDAKVVATQLRIRAWVDHWNEEGVYISFSGGKDSTVLKHIVDSMGYDIPAVFVNTGLEYPEIQQFVRKIKTGEFDCFNNNVVILRPEMRFDEVIEKYGYPVVSKRVASYAATAKRNPNSMRARWLRGEEFTKYVSPKWASLIEAPFKVSAECCNIMKKKPFKQYKKETGRHAIMGTMACESITRETEWLKHGCNAFELKEPASRPLSFWTEQDVLHYIKKYNVPYCSVYGDITVKPNANTLLGQINLIDYLGEYDEADELVTTGCSRTGCMFCMFGCHLEKNPNRFQRMKETHPKQYAYCMEKLGLKEVLEYVGVPFE